MRIYRLSLVAMASAASVPASAFAPPPPADPLPGIEKPIDGYDMRTPYQIWRVWVEREKGPVSEALLETPDEVEGLKPFGLVLRFTKRNDFGHFLTGEIRSYCRPDASGYRPVPGRCRYLLRRAYVPFDAASLGAPNPLSEWMKANFDARALARHFRAIGLAPDTDWWQADYRRMFEALPSPRAVLRANAVVVRLDSAECPAMAKKLAALEGRSITLDLPTIGSDAKSRLPAPHADLATYSLELGNGGGTARLEGWGGTLARLVRPVLKAADRCEKARNAESGKARQSLPRA